MYTLLAGDALGADSDQTDQTDQTDIEVGPFPSEIRAERVIAIGENAGIVRITKSYYITFPAKLVKYFKTQFGIDIDKERRRIPVEVTVRLNEKNQPLLVHTFKRTVSDAYLARLKP